MKKITFFALTALLACSSKDEGGGKPTSDDGTGTVPADTRPKFPAYLEISEVALLQGVKVSLAGKVDGSITRVKDRKAPVIAGRSGLFRVYVTAKRGWQKHGVKCELTLTSGAGNVETLTADFSPLESSREDDLDTTCNFNLTPKQLGLNASYAVRITDDTGEPADTSPAMYPSDGEPESLRIQAGSKLHVVVVPVKYQADMSGRVPDTGAKQIAAYKDRMLALYPATDVTVDVHDPFAWTDEIGPDGTGWSEILQAITDLRARDNAKDDVYYYGAFDPASSMSGFCRGGCVAGLSGLADDAGAAYLRASVGIGYPGQETTMAHELGHAHGRAHAPCGGAAGPDPDFPYAKGGIGAWGYDISRKELKSPSDGKDMMGYCTPEWVSDYTFNALFTRMTSIARGGVMARAERSGGSNEPSVQGSPTPTKYRMVSVNAKGASRLGATVSLTLPPQGVSQKALSYVGKDGKPLAHAQAHFFPYDHLPGGIYVFPENADYEAVDIAGVARVRRPLSNILAP